CRFVQAVWRMNRISANMSAQACPYTAQRALHYGTAARTPRTGRPAPRASGVGSSKLFGG
ncbi:MAG TPA: hypothetical protein VIL33_06670, partial [Rhodothermia bacterium]